MKFEFATARRILFGSGRLSQLPQLAGQTGRRAAFITGTHAERIMPAFQALRTCGVHPAAFSIGGEPTTDCVTRIARDARAQGCDFVVAFGGGSAIDAGKAVAALLTNAGDLTDYLEVIGAGMPLHAEPAPCIAVPTTAGTGAEVTRNAVLLSPEHRVKVSMRHPGMLPSIALVDPELTLSMPPAVTAATGLDAFTQLLEAFVSNRANPLTDGICRQGLMKAGHALPRAYIDGHDIAAREAMAQASLFGGMALANAGLGAVHGFAGPIGGMFEAPHGMVCAALLPAACRINIRTLEKLDAAHPALNRYRDALRCASGRFDLELADGLRWIDDLTQRLQVPGLTDFGITEADFPDIVEKARRASSMKGNPVELSSDDLTEILRTSLKPAGERTPDPP
jgi:alcohol dehydrogenase class IV